MSDKFLNFTDRFMQMYIQSQAMKLQSERYKQAENRYNEGLAQRKLEHEDIVKYRSGMLEQSRERTRMYGERGADIDVEIFSPTQTSSFGKTAQEEIQRIVPDKSHFSMWKAGEKYKISRQDIEAARDRYRKRNAYDYRGPVEQQQMDEAFEAEIGDVKQGLYSTVWGTGKRGFDVDWPGREIEQPSQESQEPMFDRGEGYQESLQQGPPLTNQMSPFRVPQKTPGGMFQSKELDEATAAQLLQEAGGDKTAARELAKQRGYSF